MARILIKNGRVWDGNCFSYVDVLTEKDKIVKIEPRIEEEADFVYDATGQTVSAGLVDSHVHMLVDPSDSFGIQAEMSCFPFGVTAVADAGRTRGERAFLDSFALKNVIFVSVHLQNNEVDFDKVENALLRFGDKAVGLKVYFDAEISDVKDIFPLTQICSYARKRNLRVMVHCSNSPTPMSEILETLNEGDILTHAFHGGINNGSEDDFQSMMAAQKRGVIIDAGFAGHIHTDFEVFRKALKAGVVPDSISTDITKFSAYTRGGRYGMTMCMSMARYFGMTEEDIFRCVTTSPAKALGKANEWGTLKIGGTADIAVFNYIDEGFSLTDNDGHHIESKKGYRCVLTVDDGQVVYKD